ncbi:hypothetical protein [Methylobacterium sp. NEAU K]|uniref:hypothetical protein n=1 Tax=Methylobacterium sp. NEAU K TaxID=3064946 RepID=UPI0027335D28|nr:hypothetical protein [Methylobacterium sp. NEAU K]MDP4004150.1 hypothetical protein [Methylobacterium sp. NEAU K]
MYERAEGYNPRTRVDKFTATTATAMRGLRIGNGATVERADGGSSDFLSNGAPRVLRPNSMNGAPGLTMDQANDMRAGKADGAGWAAREPGAKEDLSDWT